MNDDSTTCPVRSDDAQDHWQEHGYAVFRGLLPAAEIARLSAFVDRIHAQWLAENRSEYVERRLVNMHSLTAARYFSEQPQARREFFDALLPAALTEAMEGLFGDEGLYFHNTQLFFNPFENRRLPYWHRDLQYSPIPDAVQQEALADMLSLHVRLPLVAERGIELIPGTHRRWDTALESDVRFDRNGHRHDEDLPGAVLIDLAPGDVLVFHAQMLHRGNYRLNAERKALDLCAGTAHPLTLPYLDPTVLPDEEESRSLANPAWYERARALAEKMANVANTTAPDGSKD